MSNAGDILTGDGSGFASQGRAPYCAPCRRELAPADASRFRRWLVAELGIGEDAAVEVAEWVSFDSRETPHTTMISVRDGQRQLSFSIGKELQTIQRQDLPEMPPTERSQVR